jgi:hypothetical protein
LIAKVSDSNRRLLPREINPASSLKIPLPGLRTRRYAVPMGFHRDILALDDEDLERFVRDWIARKTSDYAEVQRFSGAGDLGRDVVLPIDGMRGLGTTINASSMGGPWRRRRRCSSSARFCIIATAASSRRLRLTSSSPRAG